MGLVTRPKTKKQGATRAHLALSDFLSLSLSLSLSLPKHKCHQVLTVNIMATLLEGVGQNFLTVISKNVLKSILVYFCCKVGVFYGLNSEINHQGRCSEKKLCHFKVYSCCFHVTTCSSSIPRFTSE